MEFRARQLTKTRKGLEAVIRAAVSGAGWLIGPNFIDLAKKRAVGDHVVAPPQVALITAKAIVVIIYC